MTDPVLLENEIAIMSALIEIAHAVGYGTKVRAETITSLRERMHESERQRDAPGFLHLPDDWSMEQIRDFQDRLRKASMRSRISE